MSLVTLKQLAHDIGMDRSHARRYVMRLGIEFRAIRDHETGQKMLAVTEEEAVTVRQTRISSGFATGEVVDAGETPAEATFGVFYVVQLVPELDPRRVKFGFAADLNTRLSQHRTAAPTAVAVRTWPCRRAWEGVAIDCLSALCRLIWSEVYEADDLAAVLARGDEFFGLMPAPDFKPALSPHSPANT